VAAAVFVNFNYCIVNAQFLLSDCIIIYNCSYLSNGYIFGQSVHLIELIDSVSVTSSIFGKVYFLE